MEDNIFKIDYDSYIPSVEEFNENQLNIYKSDPKEYLAQMGIDINNPPTSTVICGIEVIIGSNESADVVALKVMNAIEGKDFIECEFKNMSNK